MSGDGTKVSYLDPEDFSALKVACQCANDCVCGIGYFKRGLRLSQKTKKAKVRIKVFGAFFSVSVLATISFHAIFNGVAWLLSPGMFFSAFFGLITLILFCVYSDEKEEKEKFLGKGFTFRHEELKSIVSFVEEHNNLADAMHSFTALYSHLPSDDIDPETRKVIVHTGKSLFEQRKAILVKMRQLYHLVKLGPEGKELVNCLLASSSDGYGTVNDIFEREIAQLGVSSLLEKTVE